MSADRQLDAVIQHLRSGLKRPPTTRPGPGAPTPAPAALLDAGIAAHQAITAAGRALAHRERSIDVRVSTSPPRSPPDPRHRTDEFLPCRRS